MAPTGRRLAITIAISAAAHAALLFAVGDAAPGSGPGSPGQMRLDMSALDRMARAAARRQAEALAEAERRRMEEAAERRRQAEAARRVREQLERQQEAERQRQAEADEQRRQQAERARRKQERERREAEQRRAERERQRRAEARNRAAAAAEEETGDQGSEQAALPVMRRPRFASRPDGPHYPRLSVQRDEEGTVIVRALVRSRGRPDRVRVWRTSGYPRLDEAAVEAVRRWDFVPMRRGGTAVAAWVEVPVRFRLQ